MPKITRHIRVRRVLTYTNISSGQSITTRKNKVPFTPAQPTQPTEPPNSAHFLAPESEEYEAGLTVIGEFDTVESFCRYFNWLKLPSKLERNSNYHLFKSGIKPMWEDEANANGGKWVLTMKNNPQLLDRCWTWLAMALVGEDLDEGDEICGAVVSLRSKVDRIQLWTRTKDDVEKINAIGKKLVKLLDVSEADGIGLEFQVSRAPTFIASRDAAYVLFRSLLRRKCVIRNYISTTTMTVPSRTNSSPSKHSLKPHTAPHSSSPRSSTAPSRAQPTAPTQAGCPQAASAPVARSPDLAKGARACWAGADGARRGRDAVFFPFLLFCLVSVSHTGFWHLDLARARRHDSICMMRIRQRQRQKYAVTCTMSRTGRVGTLNSRPHGL